LNEKPCLSRGALAYTYLPEGIKPRTSFGWRCWSS
jgi:hypothetical protein